MIVVQILLCLLIADFLVGLVHWAEDTYCWPKLPFFGSWLCIENILHHEKPANMVNTSATFWQRNYQPIFAAVFVGGIFSLLFYSIFGYVHWMIWLTAFFGCWGNEIHYRAHMTKNPMWVVMLQDSGIILTRSEHNKHHKPPYMTRYCTMLNVTNAVLDRIKFWRGLEKLISLFGIHPKRGTDLRSGY